MYHHYFTTMSTAHHQNESAHFCQDMHPILSGDGNGYFRETDDDYCDWDYMTNGTGGCAATGRRDVPLTASIEDGKLYCSSAWDDYAQRWEFWNQDKRWVDSEHKTFTMTVEDVERANNPQPFYEPTLEDYESDRSEDHMLHTPHAQDWDDLVQSNEKLVQQLNNTLIDLKKTILELRYEEIAFRNIEHPLLVQKLATQFEVAYEAVGDSWKQAVDDLRASSCTKTRSIIDQLINYYDTMEEEYDIRIKDANTILYYRLYNVQEALECPTAFEEEQWENTDPFVVDLLCEEVADLEIQKAKLENSPFRIHKHLSNFMKLFQLISNPETLIHTPLTITTDVSSHSSDPYCAGESLDFCFNQLTKDQQKMNLRRRIQNIQNLLGMDDSVTENSFSQQINEISEELKIKCSQSTSSKLRNGLYFHILF